MPLQSSAGYIILQIIWSPLILTPFLFLRLGDIEDNQKQDDLFMLVTNLDNEDYNENLAVQSEYGGGVGRNGANGGRNSMFNPMPYTFESLDNHLDELRVSDHPHLEDEYPLYQNSVQPKSTTVRVRRSSAGDEATLICDFGDFKTQELLDSKPVQEYQPGKDQELILLLSTT